MVVKTDVKEGSDTGAGYQNIPSLAGIVCSAVTHILCAASPPGGG